MKTKDNDYRNMVDDPYLECCGGATLGADGSIDTVVPANNKKKVVVVASSIVFLVGLVVVSTYVYNKWIK